MTVKQLEERLSNLKMSGKINDNTDVFIQQTDSEYHNSLLNTVYGKKLCFDPEDGTNAALVDCLILSDEI